MKELRVTLRVRNNLLVKRREELGMTQLEFARQIGLSQSLCCHMEGLRYYPLSENGEWKPTAIRVAEFHGLPPDELWPEAIRAIIEPTQTREFDTGELRHALAASSSRLLTAAPDEVLEATETIERINTVVATLSEREQVLLREEFGLDNVDQAPSRASIARKFGVCDERLRQMEAKVFRKLQHPSRLRIVDEPLPREPPDPIERLKYGAWTPAEGRRAASQLSGPTQGETGREAGPGKAMAQKPRDTVWLEYAVDPLPLAHAFLLDTSHPETRTRHTDDGLVRCGSVEDDQPSLCGEMIANKDRPCNRHGFPLMMSFSRTQCPQCCDMVQERQRQQAKRPPRAQPQVEE